MTEETTTAVKLLLSYDVKADKGQDYHKFVLGQCLPAMQAQGLQMSEAWHTAYGDAPNRLLGFVTANPDTMNEFLESEEWQDLSTTLQEFVTEFEYKVIPYRQGFQI